MHHYAWLIGNGEVSDLMSPFYETKYDWYQVGGRWTGALSKDGYNPNQDENNIDEKGNVKWPTRWAPYHGDVVTIQDILDQWSNDIRIPYTYIFHDQWINCESFDDTSKTFKGNETFNQDLHNLLLRLDPSTKVTVIDYHL